MIKYRGKSIVEIAQERGSAAKTKTGAWRFLLANLPGPARPARSGKYDWDKWNKDRMIRRADGRALVLGYPVESEQWAWYTEAYEENYQRDRRAGMRLYRDNYGSLYLREGIGKIPATGGMQFSDRYFAALEMVKTLGAWDSIEFDKKGRADGDARHIEMFDFNADGTAAVVCQRDTEGTRYGVKTVSKTYLYVRRVEDGTILTTETRIPVARLAKQGVGFGVICHAAETGERPKLISKTSINGVYTGYKAVKINDGPGYASVWDGSHWDIGVTRIERVADDHRGGLYYYRDLQKLLDAVKDNGIFGDAHNHHKLVIVEVEATGRHINYGNKYAATRITPTREIAMTM